MPSRGLLRSFVLLWWMLGTALFVLSVRTLLTAIHGGDIPSHHVALLAMIEGAAALLFLVPRTLRLGAAALLLTLAVAWAAHLHEHFRWDLLVYASAVLFVATHGPLTGAQWLRALPGRRQS